MNIFFSQRKNPPHEGYTPLIPPPGGNERGVYKRGSALIAVIAAIAIFSVLATALLSMTSTSGRQTAQSHLADQAYLMAESAYRYVTSQYQQPPVATPDPNEVLENMDGASVALDGNDGRCEIGIFSYFYEMTAAAAATEEPTVLVVRTPGSFPSDEIDTALIDGQKVFVQGNIYTLGDGSGPIGESEDHLNFNIPELYESIDAKTLVYPVTNADDSSPWNSENRTITLSGHAEMFPARKGRIRVAGRTLTYGLKVEGTTKDQFIDVIDPNDTPMSGFSIPNNAAILLLPYIRVDATGIMGGGDAETRRTVGFFGALPVDFSETYADTFGGTDTMLTEPKGIGSHEIDTDEGVLKVTGLDTDGLYLSQLDVDADSTAIAAKEAFNDFRRSSGGYLSYDAQTKVGFYPDGGLDADDFFQDNDITAGISFRLNSKAIGEETEYNMYGLSFLHREDATSIPGYILDDITPDGMPPDEPAIVLWQQTIGDDDTVQRTWLAYKNLKTIFFDDFSQGIDGEIWTNEEDRWEWVDGALFIEGDGYYEGSISFSASLPDCDCSEFLLKFDSTVEEQVIRRQIRIYREGETEPYQPPTNIPSTEGTFPRSLALPQALGTNIIIEFYFENLFSDGLWKIDNVQIVDESALPVHNSTLLVRLKEAAVVPFQYVETATDTIETGDRVFWPGAASGTEAWGRVIAPPITVSTVPEKNYLLLNSLSDPGAWFENSNETLNVLGKGEIATVIDTPDENSHKKTNIIKVYYARETECPASEPPDDPSPMDCYAKAYGRLGLNETLKWPVQDNTQWTAPKDYFRLIQWDEINSAAVMDTDINGTIIFSHHEKLESSTVGGATTEFGLHAMGADAANHVYFDDFGFQLFYHQDALFPTALQQ